MYTFQQTDFYLISNFLVHSAAFYPHSLPPLPALGTANAVRKDSHRTEQNGSPCCHPKPLMLVRVLRARRL